MKSVLKNKNGFIFYEVVLSLFIICFCIIPLIMNITAIKIKSNEADNYFIAQNLLYDYKFQIYDKVDVESNNVIELNNITYYITIDNIKICVKYTDTKERSYCEEYK